MPHCPSLPELALSGVRCRPELWSDCPPNYPEKIEGALKRYEKFIKVGAMGGGAVGGWKGSIREKPGRGCNHSLVGTAREREA